MDTKCLRTVLFANPIAPNLRHMPTIRPVGDKWRAEVRKRGVSASQNFRTKTEAAKWAAQMERDIEDRRVGKPTTATLRDAVERYRKTVSEKKRSWRSEGHRLNRLLQASFIDRPLADITADDWSKWREGREVSPASVNREMNVIRHIYRHICNEWGWLTVNPMQKIKDFPEPASRQYLWSDEAVQEMIDALGYPGFKTMRQRVAIAFLFALETGMRAGEIFGLRRADLVGRVAMLRMTKNGEPRAVPLSSRAMSLLAEIPETFDPVFGVPQGSADAIFREFKPKHLAHLRFHDARHTAATRLGGSGKLTALELARIFGWRDMDHALIYFHPSAESLAAKLD